MRSLHRNRRTLYYAKPIGTESIKDEYGNDTLELKTTYSEVIPLRVNVSANVGQEAMNVFGSLTGYNRTVTWCGEDCPLTEGSIVWFGVDTKKAHNYVVIKVADSKNGFLVALREVSDRG
jgi:hypothetical protein